MLTAKQAIKSQKTLLPMGGKARKLTMLIRAFDHPFRNSILDHINTQDEVNQTDLIVLTRTEDQSVMAQHLAILLNAGLIYFKREGKFKNYFIDFSKIKQVKEILKLV